MKKTIGIVFVFILCISLFTSCENNAENATTEATSAATATATPKPFSYPFLEWIEFGMKEGEVRGHYVLQEPREYLDLIIFDQIDPQHAYGFSSGNKLLTFSYFLQSHYYLDAFHELKQEYGDSYKEQEKWNNTRYKDDKAMLDKAIENGDYIKTATWKLDKCYVILVLDKAGVNIHYTQTLSNHIIGDFSYAY